MTAEMYCPVIDGPCQAINRTACISSPHNRLCEQKIQEFTDLYIEALVERFSQEGDLKERMEEPITKVTAFLQATKKELGFTLPQMRSFYLHATLTAHDKFFLLAFEYEGTLAEKIQRQRRLEDRIHPVE